MIRYFFRLLPSLWVGLFFSLFINLLALTFIFYLRLVIDKVSASKSMETLLLLTVVAVGAYIVSGVLETLRAKLLTRSGERFEQLASPPVFGGMLNGAVAAGAPQDSQKLQDISSLRNFLGGVGITALFDVPWVPIYLAVVYLFHPILGLVATAGALLLVGMVFVQELTTKRLEVRRAGALQAVQRFVGATQRNAQSVNAMGMLPALTRRWRTLDQEAEEVETRLAERNALFRDLAKAFLMGTILMVMATGAYLTINNAITLGTMISASLFMGRGLAPLLMLGAGWDKWQEARLAYNRLQGLLPQRLVPVAKAASSHPPKDPGPPASRIPAVLEMHEAEDQARTAPPTQGLSVTPLSLQIEGKTVLSAPGFHLEPGKLLVVTGANGAGKSTLARVLLGLWTPDEGEVRLDGVLLQTADRDQIGPRIGYLPQNIALFAASVAENIARLGEIDSEAVVTAAKHANAHDMILKLPQGYDTLLGAGNVNLSGGQKQRVALARALYQTPDLLVLDEPDSHLDQQGRAALGQVIKALRESGACTVLISHNPELAGTADLVLNLDAGELLPPERLLTQETKTAMAAATPQG